MIIIRRHPQAQMLWQAARNNRLRSVAENIRIPLGSEDGNAVTAQYLMFRSTVPKPAASGWSDADIHRNKQSPLLPRCLRAGKRTSDPFTPGKLERYLPDHGI